MINLIKTNTMLTVSVPGKRPFFISTSEVEKVKAIEELYRRNDEQGILEYLDKRAKIVKWSDANIYVEDEQVKIKGDDSVVPAAIAKRILAFYEQKLPYQPLVNFWMNLRKNPSDHSINQLYGFLEKNHHAITPDGKFVAYKKVTRLPDGRLVDSHSRTFSNEVGLTVQMNRDNVDPNPNQTCSYGLHVASWEYAQGFSGNVLIEVHVNPKDVVAVPTDYNNQKMRTCEYKVVAIYADTKPIEDELRGTYVKEDSGDHFDDRFDVDQIDLTNCSYDEIEALCSEYGNDDAPMRNDYDRGIDFIEAAAEYLTDLDFKVTTRKGVWKPS